MLTAQGERSSVGLILVIVRTKWVGNKKKKARLLHRAKEVIPLILERAPLSNYVQFVVHKQDYLNSH